MPKPNRAIREVQKPSPQTCVCTFRQLAEAIPALQALMKLPFPAQQSYHIAKLARLVDQEVKALNTQRDDLIKELGEDVTPSAEEQAKGMSPYQRVKTEHLVSFRDREKELHAVEVTIPYGGIPAAWLKDKELAPEVFYGLEPLLVGELG